MRVGPIMLCLAAAASAQERDLTSLSLEEFLNVEVTSVRRSRQKLSRTAAAVFVITQEDIRRSGLGSLPEILRLAPGVHVARITGNNWAIGIRGFTSLHSNKLLVMVDGRTLYHPLLSGVLWNENLMTLSDIDRIEVIRGPGATMWGSNAVSGVVNIITKRASATQGAVATATAGTVDRARMQLRHGGKLGDAGHWRVSSSAAHMGPLAGPEAPSLRSWDAARAGARFDWSREGGHEFTVSSEAQYGNAPMNQILVSSDGRAGLQRVVGGGKTGFLAGRWSRTSEDENNTTLQATYDGRYTGGGSFGAEIKTLDLDFQSSRRLPGRHQLMAGAGFRSNQLQTTSSPWFAFSPPDATYRIYSALLQDEWQLLPETLYVTVGAKLEHNWGTGLAFQPNVRLLWAPAPRFVAWGSWSRAVRTPSHVDFALRYSMMAAGLPVPVELNGNPAADSERLNGFDAGVRWQPGPRLAFDIALFDHGYRGLMAYQLPASPAPVLRFGGAGAVLPATTANGLNGRNRGGEAVIHIDAHRRWQISGAYSALWTRTSARPGFEGSFLFPIATYDPRHQGYVRNSWDFPWRLSGDCTVWGRGALKGESPLGASLRVDFRVARAFGEGNEVAFSAQNLGRSGRFEVPVDLLVSRGVMRRAFEITITRRF
ncbi:MAG TPA: hypothetical protein DEH78_18065 [Solibacterales bacterium]|nr:hypothetical protein [Bryobacterales bacterium]